MAGAIKLFMFAMYDFNNRYHPRLQRKHQANTLQARLAVFIKLMPMIFQVHDQRNDQNARKLHQ